MEGFEADNDRDYTPFSQSDDDSLLTDGKGLREGFKREGEGKGELRGREGGGGGEGGREENGVEGRVGREVEGRKEGRREGTKGGLWQTWTPVPSPAPLRHRN